MLTQIEPSMRKQGGGGAVKRAAAPLFWHGRLYLCQRLIFSCGNGASFLISSLRFIFKAFCIRFHYTCSLHVPSMFLNPVAFLVNLSINMACSNKRRIAIYIYLSMYYSSKVVQTSCVKLSSRVYYFQGSGQFASQPIYFLKRYFVFRIRISYIVL